MYEKDGEKYFIVDEHQHFWNARPDNWVEGRENLAKGWIDCFYGYHQLGPPETHWDMEKYQRWTVEDYEHGRVRGGPRRLRRPPVDLPQVLVQGGLQHHRAQPARSPRPTLARSSSTAAGTRVRARRAPPVRGGPQARTTSRASSSTPPSGTATRAATRSTTRRPTGSWSKTQELGIKNIHLHKGPTIWPLDKDAFDDRGRRPGRHGLPGAELHRRARGHAADRATSPTSPCRSRTCTPACPW